MPVPIARSVPGLVKLKPLTAVGIYIFAGGFSCGVRQAGFKVLCHLEGNSYGVSSAKLNWPDLPVYIGNEQWPLDDLKQQRPDFMYCNPPCAPWSTAGPSTTKGPDAWRTDPRIACWHQCFQAFETVRPKVFAIESVTQVYSKGREVVDDFTRRALKLGYSVQHVLLDAKWTGIPQSRRRFFLVFHKPWLPLEFRFDFADPPTVGEVLANVDDPGPYCRNREGQLKTIKEMQPGEKMKDAFMRLNPGIEKDERGVYPGRPGFLVTRLHPDTQMGAFIGDVFFHPEEHRHLGVQEMKSLCGYPLDFQLAGTQGQHSSLLARAVLPPVGKWLGTMVRSVIGQPVKSWCKPEVQLVDIRNPPGKYLSLNQYYDLESTKLTQLACQARSCTTCDVHTHRRIISQASGPEGALVMFVGEAPGHDNLGHSMNGVPLYGGATGINFDQLLKSAGLTHNQIFMTNAVLCSPTGPGGTNQRPSQEQLAACSDYLRRTIEAVQPQVVAPLGSVALSALEAIEPHGLLLSSGVGRPRSWFGRVLVPLYHPSPRAVTARSMELQQRDFLALKKVVGDSQMKPMVRQPVPPKPALKSPLVTPQALSKPLVQKTVTTQKKPPIVTRPTVPIKSIIPLEGERSRAYVRRLAASGSYSDEELLAMTRQAYSGKPGGGIGMSSIRKHATRGRAKR